MEEEKTYELSGITKLVLPLAFLATAIGGITMGPMKKMWLPQWPSDQAFLHDMPPLTWKTAFHWLKNIFVECVRADPQWWAKFLSLIIVLEFTIICLG